MQHNTSTLRGYMWLTHCTQCTLSLFHCMPFMFALLHNSLVKCSYLPLNTKRKNVNVKEMMFTCRDLYTYDDGDTSTL